MAFAYFAYGSNLWPLRMRSRCPSAVVIASARLAGWEVRYAKPGRDGTAKLDIVPAPGAEVHGAVYAIDERDRPSLDAAEPGYDVLAVGVETDAGPLDVVTYRWPGMVTDARPADWYRRMAMAGARLHRLPEAYVGVALRG
jgi:hypothetical protein